MPNDVYEPFASWLDAALSSAPDSAAGFYFNLYEYEDAYSIQVASTTAFADVDSDWAMTQVFFVPEDYLFFLKRLEGDDDWRRALQEALGLIKRYLAEGSRASTLKRSRGVGCAFVDGDEYIVWSAA